MLFGKYQYKEEDIQLRGYSDTVQALTADGTVHWVKWIRGVQDTEDRVKAFQSRLRRYQRAKHRALPQLVEHGWDKERKALAMVYALVDGKALKERITELKAVDVLAGLKDVGECLAALHAEYDLYHGDLHPRNILVDGKGQFHVVDLGLAHLTHTLSQVASLQIFAADYAAPEKLEHGSSPGFPYQADVYSFGKVLAWAGRQRSITWSKEASSLLERMLAKVPADRPQWPVVTNEFGCFERSLARETIRLSFAIAADQVRALPHFQQEGAMVRVWTKGPRLMLDVVAGPYMFKGTEWKPGMDGTGRLELPAAQPREQKKEGGFKKLSDALAFAVDGAGPWADLAPLLRKWEAEREAYALFEEQRKKVREDLKFYEGLMREELRVLNAKAFKGKFKRIDRRRPDLHVYLGPSQTFSSGRMQQWLKEKQQEGGRVPFVISRDGNVKDRNGNLEGDGYPRHYDEAKDILVIRDWHGPEGRAMPSSGFLLEDVSMQETVYKRQLQAIQKARELKVQNPDLVHTLLTPDKLALKFLALDELPFKAKQRDAQNKPFNYSDNQRDAILRALHRKPLSLIQGPPGTGKTTVITEVVLQYLEAHPGAKVLITSQSNLAVDQVLAKVATVKQVVRLQGEKSDISPAMQKLTPQHILQGWRQAVLSRAGSAHKREEQALLDELKSAHPMAESIASLVLSDKWTKNAITDIERLAGMTKGLEPLREIRDREDAFTKFEAATGFDLKRIANLSKLMERWRSVIKGLDDRSAIRQRLLDSVQVIGATCNHIASNSYRDLDLDFDLVIMDESGRATVAEAMVPIVMASHLVLVGDHRQLPPMLTSTDEVKEWVKQQNKKLLNDALDRVAENGADDYLEERSLFEQVALGLREVAKEELLTQLTECRRMSQAQVELTSKWFYEAEGDASIECAGRTPDKELDPSINVPSSILFIDIGRMVDNGRVGSSKVNERTRQVVMDILERLDRHAKPMKEYTVGVITCYKAQKDAYASMFAKLGREKLANVRRWDKEEEKFRLDVVDRFQGHECDIIILDLVCSGPRMGLGFMTSPNRMNVALSRQKRLLVIVGDYQGTINAKPGPSARRGKAPLQEYLGNLDPAWIIPAEHIDRAIP
jgi:hypothetical protein